MTDLSRRSFLGLGAVLAVAACGAPPRVAQAAGTGASPQVTRLINRYADYYDMPESLVHRVVRRESGYNPSARNGNYYGLMQIDPRTARTMGYTGAPSGLLDAETNLKYAGKYLRGAWLVAQGSEDRAVMWYSRGYYYEAKRLGLLQKAGLSG